MSLFWLHAGPLTCGNYKIIVQFVVLRLSVRRVKKS